MPTLMKLDVLVETLTGFLRITDAELAHILDVSPRTVERWKAGATFPQHESRQRLEALEALVHRLDESFKTPDGARLWLHAASGYFGGLKPIDALLRGRIDAVDAALEALDSGIFV
jgi:hypothetical protein